MLDWLKTWLAALQNWLQKTFTDILKWFYDKIESAYKWIVDLVKAIIKAAWDVFQDAVCWLIDKFFDIIKAALEAVDVSPLETFAQSVQIPPEIMNVLQLSGTGTAIGIIVAAIGIRLVLQLIPFTRLGS